MTEPMSSKGILLHTLGLTIDLNVESKDCFGA